MAAAWADAYTDPDEQPDDPDKTGRARRRGGPDEDGYIQAGGPGTPWICETCPAELGVAQQQSAVSARYLIGDALDLRHRLPRLWTRVQAGQVHGWKARAVASRSRYLSLRPAGELDRQVAHQIELVSWGRFEDAWTPPCCRSTRPPTPPGRRSRRRGAVWADDAEAGLRTLIIVQTPEFAGITFHQHPHLSRARRRCQVRHPDRGQDQHRRGADERTVGTTTLSGPTLPIGPNVASRVAQQPVPLG